MAIKFTRYPEAQRDETLSINFKGPGQPREPKTTPDARYSAHYEPSTDHVTDASTSLNLNDDALAAALCPKCPDDIAITRFVGLKEDDEAIDIDDLDSESNALERWRNP